MNYCMDCDKPVNEDTGERLWPGSWQCAACWEEGAEAREAWQRIADRNLDYMVTVDDRWD